MSGTHNGTVLKKMTYNGQKVKKWKHNGVLVYSAGEIVTYYVNGVVYKEEVEDGKTVLSPTSFTPSVSGATFLGWSESKSSTSVLTSKVMNGEPITLYGVWKVSGSATVYSEKNDGSESTQFTISGPWPNNSTVYETIRGWRTYSIGSEYNSTTQYLTSALGQLACSSNGGSNSASRSTGSLKSITYTVTATSRYDDDDWFDVAAQGTATVTWVG